MSCACANSIPISVRHRQSQEAKWAIVGSGLCARGIITENEHELKLRGVAFRMDTQIE